MARKLIDIARDVVESWGKWCEAEGWDNSEYDGLSDALNELEAHIQEADAKEKK